MERALVKWHHKDKNVLQFMFIMELGSCYSTGGLTINISVCACFYFDLYVWSNRDIKCRKGSRVILVLLLPRDPLYHRV